MSSADERIPSPVGAAVARSSAKAPLDHGASRRRAFGSREDTLEGIEELREGLPDSTLKDTDHAVPRKIVREIFVTGRDTDLYYYEIAEKYDVSRATVGRIVRRERVRYRRLTADLVGDNS